MSDQACAFYARKYFPHLLPAVGTALVKELWKLHHPK
jgi:hypothetical protein